ncbi:unnamed protein product, partial [Mesorhabditis spiculigera]
MVHYKLHYFGLYARGEPIRQVFALAGQEFEDTRYSMEEWPQHKADMPFGQLPVLEVDGELLPQSMAILRFVGRRFGYAGKTDVEQAQVDAIADQFQDYFNEFKAYFVVAVGFAPGDKEQLFNSVMIPARNKMFQMLSQILRSNGTGFLVGDSVTYADLLLSIHVAGMDGLTPGFANDYPRLLEHRQRVESIPALKHYLETRPFAPF